MKKIEDYFKSDIYTCTKSIEIARKKFIETHPKNKWPNWLEQQIRIEEHKNQYNKWIISINLMRKIKLESNQYWELSEKGNNVLVEVDKVTGEKSYILCGISLADYDTIFKVEVDLDNNSTTMLLDTDLNTLDKNKYQIVEG